MVTIYPASGYRNATSGALAATDAGGWCWSCAVTVASAYSLGFDSSVVYLMYGDLRASGFPVRCVQYLLLSL
ncbi:MAG: hypothetical protein LBU44_00750 [Mediterranea sp.]|nr:hypothetical protein [Mediterranea sp.]